ncbi:uncharacterized protein LOC123510484 [Portunus trituberculatus]|uniref:uncharacterized protein LOC123510484 n=1 Tax=Portunus trituberculatus TaxID=210409 RepID=UPI001E1D1DE7|nr:uncharacterized protein LOC123510484 [Portunus trituberculatus]XP_045121630.1 uncharacterized protein LOC123510484 [Portunus trituberculatus]XP_045121631.1 uncharacterized protein LOC123510484 [Portunus trituberculatus]
MEHSGDHTKIHFNPDFISRGRILPPNQKVHINPAFLQKSEPQKYVTPAVSYTHGTGLGQHWQAPSSGTGGPVSQMSASLLHTQDGNTATNVYTYSSKNHDHTVLSNHPKSYSNLYRKSNLCNPYDKNFSRHKTQNIATQNIGITKHPSTYSWKATNTFNGASFQRNSSMSVNGPSSYVYPNPPSKYSSVNKSLIRTTVVSRGGTSQAEIQLKKNNPPASHFSLHYISRDKRDTQSVRCLVKVNTVSNLDVHKVKSEEAPSTIVPKGNSGIVTQSASQNLPIVKLQSDAKHIEKLPHATGGALKTSDSLKTPKRKVILASSPPETQATASCTTLKPVPLIPNQKWVSKTKVVNSSKKPEAKDVKSSSARIVLKTPKQKGNYKIITKTKLVRTNSNSASKNKVQLQAVTRGQGQLAQNPKTTHASPRMVAILRHQKISPLTRIHQTARFSNKKKYSVLSHTKLVRRQSLTGKAGTPGKPRYTVNTKTKLIRRRSNSGTGPSKSTNKNSESKVKTSKPETEKQKKFHVLSKTKIVRRRSSSGTYKTASPQGTTPGHTKKRAIVKRHKLVRNVSSPLLKHETSKFQRNINTAFKVINSNKFSTKQRVAKGIVSKYKINRLKMESYDGFKKYKSFDRYKVNRLKLESVNVPRRYRKFSIYSSKAVPKEKYKFQNKKTSKHSDRFINIGGILYKSTKTSLRKQLPKVKETSTNKHDSTCTVLLRGEKFHLTAGGRTLQRVKDSTAPRSSLSRVHLGGLTYSRTRTGLYELTKTHQARAVLSSARHRSMVTLMHKRKKASFQKRNEYCVFFNRFGRCSKKNRGECPYIHDPSRVAICTRFLRGRCPVSNCPFSHTVDPDKMPVCSHFLQAACSREDCPYRHVKVNPSAPVCLDFVRGHCKAGKECDKQHILICEEFKTGKCPRGVACPLSHHKGRKRIRKVSFSKESNRKYNISIHRKRKRSESHEVLGASVTKKKVEKKKQEVKASSSHQRYFHVMAPEESEVKDTDDAPDDREPDNNAGQRLLQEEGSQCVTKTQPEAQGPGVEVQNDKVEFVSHNGKSVFEETRSRVMKKIDKIKKSYAACNYEDYNEKPEDSDTGSNVGDCKREPKDSHHADNTKEKVVKANTHVRIGEVSAQDSSDTQDTDSDADRVQRPPLPKRLPSYIPLDSV